MQDTESNLESNILRYIINSKRNEPVLNVVLNSSQEMLWVYGHAKNVLSKLPEQPMTLNYNAKIIVDAKENTKAIFDSVNADNEFYPENPTKTTIKFDNKIKISIESDQLSHLRANLNSTLRLIQASNDSIESVKV